MHRIRSSLMVLTTAAVLWPLQAAAQTTVYRCPGNVYTSSADISAKEAEAKGCKTIEGAPITVNVASPGRTSAVFGLVLGIAATVLGVIVLVALLAFWSQISDYTSCTNDTNTTQGEAACKKTLEDSIKDKLGQ